MAEVTFKLPDIGEGIAEAELADWLVKIGQVIQEDDVICEVTTDKATVEIPASVGGRVTWLGGKPGDVIAIGSDLIRIETDAGVSPKPARETAPATEPDAPAPAPVSDAAPPPPAAPVLPEPPVTRRAAPRPTRPRAVGVDGRPLAAPSVRSRAREMGIDLRRVRGSGPAGRILHEDLDDYLAHGDAPPQSPARAVRDRTEEIRVTGIRRAIAERMALSKSRIPHFSIIEEVDVDALEELRASLNRQFGDSRGKLTLLPFVLRALSEAVLDHPEINAHYDDEAGVITRHAALHCGIATQTGSGLMVPVVQHAEALTLWDTAREIRRLSAAARDRRATPKELSGSTITVTSLGALGAIATTPIINHPEVAIVGINKMTVRPVWTGSEFLPRRMMNLSCSFDHRVVDGWVAAEFVAKLKQLLEVPAMLFMEWRDE
ncbi:dihydrolipoamide acetyltransferase family protein [Pseudodonghicola xiamenensis]|uniref:Dihydrolipoamide acetyltransferase component of pyruvate dehydrogenase complex n=1 Tax=Pseudodonghicola xiamenensis TaxID=337702 RepID=A0A8J3HAD8_9RHOB|nr:dihydrolipoamide acetyltransferase family protein [Pseudodonghicola xiamenensis]GHG96330.1 dihydrolipoamide acetyltransferase component of pyruvate dehydrogenase complex [Pseudodonghicola xiamenensis]